jgi:phage tail-like protein
MDDSFGIVAAAFFDLKANGHISYGVWASAKGGTQKLKEVKAQFITSKGKPMNSISSAGFDNTPLTLERQLIKMDRTALVKWYNDTRDGNHASARQDVDLIIRDNDGGPLLQISYFRCLATDYSLSGMDAQSGNAVMEKLVIHYEDMIIKSA